MKWAMTIIMLTGTALAGSYSPSSKSVDERDKPQLEQDQVLMPEQKVIRQE